jgi:hypothetical protein
MLEVRQVQETTELLAVQVDALIKRVAAKDEEFAKERRAHQRLVESKNREITTLKRELKKLKPATPRKGGTNVFE